jgi:hypothetical protein
MGMACKIQGAGFLPALVVAASYSGESSDGISGLRLGLWAEIVVPVEGGVSIELKK